MSRLSPRSMIVVLFSALYAISVSACGHGNASSPIASVFDAPRSSQSIVSAAGNGEAQVQRYIADAGQAGKVARFVTVSTKNAQHVFTPSATVLRSGKALIVLSYSRMYVWPLSAVTVTYSAKPGSAIDLTTLPAVSTPKLDRRIAKFEAGIQPIRQKVPAGEQLCGDCVLLMGKPSRSGKPDPWLQFEDPWQRQADYTSWQDPAIIAQTTASAGKSLSSARVAQDDIECDTLGSCTTYFGGMSNTYYTASGGGGSTNTPACSISSVAVAAPTTARTMLGVGELVRVSASSVSPSTSFSWSLNDGSNGSKLNTLTGSQVTFTAASTPVNATVTVIGDKCGQNSISFKIIAPTGILYVTQSGNRHTLGFADIGLRTNLYLQPDGVSFSNIGILEKDVAAVADGPYICLNGMGHDPTATPIQVGDDVYPLGSAAATDTAYSGSCGNVNQLSSGTISYAVPDWYTYNGALVQQFISTPTNVTAASGTLNFTKGSGTATPLNVNSPTSTFPPLPNP